MKVLKTALACAFVFLLLTGEQAQAQDKKPNILVIWGDDIGWFNISAYNDGMMGYKTPNIDRIADENARFTDWCGQKTCTAGIPPSSPVSRRSAPECSRSGPGPGLCLQVDRKLQGVPARPGGGELEHRQGVKGDDFGWGSRQVMSEGLG